MGNERRFVLPALTAILFAVGIADAVAQTQACAGLEARLATLGRQAADPWNDGANDLDGAISRQRNELEQATTEARRAGCMAGFFSFKKPAAKCRPLNAAIKRMQANLDRLHDQRRNMAGDPYAADRERSDVLRQLADNGCGEQYEAYAYSGPRRRNGLFARLFGNGRIRTWGGQDDWFGGPDFGFGTFRTLCVRTCDGYYFPISFSADSAKFGEDQALCQARCPGTEVALYVHRNPGEDVTAMVSLSGEPYSNLPAAFRYRKEYDSACRCGAVTASTGAIDPGYSPIDTIPPAPIPEVASPADAYLPTLPSPKTPVTGGEDPETVANRAGSLVPGETEKRETAPPPEPSVVETTSDGKRVRIVGPNFYVPQ
jgi:hypothetical protein